MRNLTEGQRYLAFIVAIDVTVFLIAFPIALHYEPTLRAVIVANLAVATTNIAVALLNVTRIGR